MTSRFPIRRLPFAFVLLAARGASAAPLNDVETQLTGGATREWVFAGSKSYMGDGCSEGQEVDVFKADHTLSVTTCVNSQSVKTNHTWHTYPNGDLDQVLVIDGASYLLLFRKEGAHQLMRLRTQSTSKTEPTVDRDFRLSED